MPLTHWQPWRELNALRQQMDSLFEDLLHSNRKLGLLPGTDETWAPAIELKETDTEIMVKAQIPGIDAKNLDVQVSQDSVSIAGEYQQEKTTDEGIFHSEFRYGQFQRIIPLPTLVENEQVKSEFKDGVLTLTLPKVQGMPRKVVKIDLSLQEKARESMTHQRQHQEHLQQTMHSRAAAEVERS